MIVNKLLLTCIVVPALAFALRGNSTTPIYNSPIIESILKNPDIIKKQLSATEVSATGFYNASKKQFVVHFKREKLHGVWQTYFENNLSADSGSFKNSLPDGLWKTWYPNGQLKTVRNYSAGKFLYIKNDLFINHPRNQRYVITRLAQQKKDVEGYFRPDYNSEIDKRTTLLGRIQHNTAAVNDNYMAPFNQSLHHGIFVNYAANGAVKDSGNYVNGLRNGLWKETDTSITATGFYQHGCKTGQWKYYDASGMLVYTEHYNQHGERKAIYHFIAKP